MANVPGVADCRFCGIVAGTVPAHVVLRDEVAVGFLDARPVFKGHVLVVPVAHYVTLADLPAALVGPLFTRVQRVSAAMPPALGAQGSFVGENNIVSQSVPHLHVHVIPGPGATACAGSSGRAASTPTTPRPPATPAACARCCPRPSRGSRSPAGRPRW